MRRALIQALVLSLATALAPAQPAQAGERSFLGHGYLLGNDLIGDGQDRWRTASIASSRIWGQVWQGRAPQRFGELLELRFGGQIIAPRWLDAPPPPIDRPYAGALSLGLHSHASAGPLDYSAGLDIVVTGPQTGLDRLQGALHGVADAVEPSAAVRAGQVPNGVHPTLVAEAGLPLQLGRRGQLRPFAEARWGDETLLRLGADLTLGQIGGPIGGHGELLVRDPVSGHRYRVLGGEERHGLSFVLGADIAHVEHSIYIPSASRENSRTRLRGGLHWQGTRGLGGFYGLSWLSPEVKGQGSGQLTGALRVDFNF